MAQLIFSTQERMETICSMAEKYAQSHRLSSSKGDNPDILSFIRTLNAFETIYFADQFLRELDTDKHSACQLLTILANRLGETV